MVKKGKAKKREMMKLGQTAAVDDDRFLDLTTHPMFKEILLPKKKVIIDKRFKEIFDEHFSEEPSKVDRRGRRIRRSAANNDFTKLYEFEVTDKSKPEEKDADDDENDENDEKSSIASDSESREVRIDLARGEGNISSSSSSEEEEEDSGNEFGASEGYQNDDLFEKLEKDVTYVECASTRLAICNLEWDSLCAKDIFVVLNSFTPESGKIQSVSVYRSDFGVKYEELEKSGSGPASINLDELDSDDKIQTSNKVRAYELDRLRCFYAICHCDSDATAIALYEACNGFEYRNSGVKFDLRFVPSEMDFPESRLHERATADDLNEKQMQNYKPKKFVNFALSNCKPKCSWEQHDRNRARARFMEEAFKKETNLDEFSCLIASASESSDDESFVKDRVKTLLDAANNNYCTEMVEIADGEDENGGMHATEGGEDEEGDEDEEMFVESGDAGKLLYDKRKKVDGKTNYKLWLEKARKIRSKKKRKQREKLIERKRQLGKECGKANAVAQSKKASANDFISIEPSVGKADGDQLLGGDERFNALVIDSSFAIEKTHAAYNGGDLADRQVRAKIKKRNSLARSIA